MASSQQVLIDEEMQVLQERLAELSAKKQKLAEEQKVPAEQPPAEHPKFRGSGGAPVTVAKAAYDPRSVYGVPAGHNPKGKAAAVAAADEDTPGGRWVAQRPLPKRKPLPPGKTVEDLSSDEYVSSDSESEKPVAAASSEAPAQVAAASSEAPVEDPWGDLASSPSDSKAWSSYAGEWAADTRDTRQWCSVEEATAKWGAGKWGASSWEESWTAAKWSAGSSPSPLDLAAWSRYRPGARGCRGTEGWDSAGWSGSGAEGFDQNALARDAETPWYRRDEEFTDHPERPID